MCLTNEQKENTVIEGVILNLLDNAHRLRHGSEFTVQEIAGDISLLAMRLQRLLKERAAKCGS